MKLAIVSVLAALGLSACASGPASPGLDPAPGPIGGAVDGGAGVGVGPIGDMGLGPH